MKTLSFAGLASLAALGVQPSPSPRIGPRRPQSLVVTATRRAQPCRPLRDVVVITRETSSAAARFPRRAPGASRADPGPRDGGAGPAAGALHAGRGNAQTLVLVDGLRVSSATVGTTSIENIPLELIERIEVVKGPLSSLYGSDAIGGVVQVFTRGTRRPALLRHASYGTDNDGRLSTGLVAVGRAHRPCVLRGRAQGGLRRAPPTRARSATTRTAIRTKNAFRKPPASYRMWQDELVAIDAFITRGQTAFDGCGTNDRNEQTIAGRSSRRPTSSRRVVEPLQRSAMAKTRS
jgi:vitamin B12 transporter